MGRPKGSTEERELEGGLLKIGEDPICAGVSEAVDIRETGRHGQAAHARGMGAVDVEVGVADD